MPEGTDKDQSACIDVDWQARRPVENVKRRKPNVLVLRVATREFLQKALQAHQLAAIKGSRRQGEEERKEMALEVNQNQNDTGSF